MERGSTPDRTGIVAQSGKRITRHVAPIYEPEVCTTCDGSGLMPGWKRDQLNAAQPGSAPQGTNCDACRGQGTKG